MTRLLRHEMIGVRSSIAVTNPEEDEMVEDYSEARMLVDRARAALAAGARRDDVYHEVVRFAAINKLDRYGLWQRVVE